MRGKKIILSFMLAIMLLSSVAAVLLERHPNTSSQQLLQSRLAELKARVASAIRAAEAGAGGRAVSVRLDESSSKPRWVIVVDTAGKKLDVVVDDAGSIISTTDHVDLPQAHPADIKHDDDPIPAPNTGSTEHK